MSNKAPHTSVNIFDNTVPNDNKQIPSDDTRKDGYKEGQALNASEFNNYLDKVQKWTAYLNAERNALTTRVDDLANQLSTLKSNHDALKAKEAATIGQIVYFPVGADVVGDYLLLNGKELDVSAYKALWYWANANSKVIYHGQPFHNFYDADNKHITYLNYNANSTSTIVNANENSEGNKHHAAQYGFVAVGTTSNNKASVTKFKIPDLRYQYFRQVGPATAYSQPFNRLAQSYQKHDHNISIHGLARIAQAGEVNTEGPNQRDITPGEPDTRITPAQMPSRGGAETRPHTVMLGAYIKAK